MAENPKPIDPATLALAQAILAGGGGTQSTGAISAPQGTANVVIKNDKFDPSQPITPDNYPIISVPSPNAAVKPTEPKEPTVFGSDDTGRYVLDPASPNGVRLIVPPHTPNADDEISKALKREQDEQLRAQRIKNEAAGFGYADDDTVAKRSLEARAAGLDDKKYAQSKAQDDEKIRQFDITNKQAQEKQKADIGLTTANTGLASANTARTGAETQQITQNINVTGAKLPGEIAQQGATLAGTQASTAASQAQTAQAKQATQIAGAPQVQAPPTGMYQYSRDPITGEVKATGINPEYQAKTQAEVAARVGQIQSVMQSKQAELQGKVGQTVAGKLYTADDALKDYNAWHTQNVAPQLGALQAAQQDAAFARAKDEAAMRTNAYNAASQAGTQAINAAKEDKSGRVGPGFGDFMNKITAGKGLATGADFGNAFTFQAPLAADQAHNAVMDALKHISPTAAAATGSPMPNYQNVDIAGQLGAMPYWPQGQQASGAPPPPAAVTAPAAPAPALAAPPPGGLPTDDWFQAWRGRQAVDVAAQQRQAQVAGSPDQWSQWIPDYSLA